MATSEKPRPTATAQGLCDFVDASPSPFHVCESVAAELRAHGFTELTETGEWPHVGGRHFIVRGGSLIAWAGDGAGAVDSAAAFDAARPFRVVGAHTDSPNLRVKQHPDLRSADWQMVGLEPYGGAWLNSWLDRDLGISGRLAVRAGDRVEHRLVRVDEPVLRVPQLAIHLSERRTGVELDPQRHLNAIDPPSSGVSTDGTPMGSPQRGISRYEGVGPSGAGARAGAASPVAGSGGMLATHR